MKKLLYIFAAISIIFSACEEDTPAPSTNNNSTGTIADVVGIWKFIGEYDASGNLQGNSSNVNLENCVLQDDITLQSDGNAIMTYHYLQYEDSGPCLYESTIFTFNYINSTTLEFLIANISSCGDFAITLPTPTQLRVPGCNGDTGDFDGWYSLYELQP
tara:strand:- start:270 stop:746 length:477 start_codon:yes stop_codon:yes gene_type:complete